MENGTHGDIQRIIEVGLKYVHNDTCYPAALVIGQFIDALDSGEYDVHKTALMLFQTCGGCRASNYLPLLRKALKKAGYGFIPVISLNFSGIEKNPGFHITLPMLYRAVYALLYGDLLMTLVAQCQPYEIQKGSAQALADRWVEKLTGETLEKVEFTEVRGAEGIKEAVYHVAGMDVKVAAASGLSNAKRIMDKVRAGEADYHFIEIMCCPGGCVNGGGQPQVHADVRNFQDVKAIRAKALYDNDAAKPIRKSHENPSVQKLYREYLGEPGSERAHHILHTTYVKRSIN